MNIIRRRIATMLIITFIGLALLAACESATVPVTGSFATPQPVYVAAQSTLDYGQSQMDELSRRATLVDMNMAQAANAAQSTLYYGQVQMEDLSRQATMVFLNNAQAADASQQARWEYYQQHMMELASQATVVSLNMAQAAASQRLFAEQTQMIWDATASAQSYAATATYSANTLNATQTAQSQAILNANATATAQAIAAMTAVPLTVTPLAQTQAAVLFQQRKYEQQSFWGDIVTPVKIVLTTLVILLLILGCILVFRRFMPVLEFRMLNPGGNGNISHPFLMNGTIVDLDPHHLRLAPLEPHQATLSQLPSDGPPAQVEIISPSEPSIARWITEAEQELHHDRDKDL